MMQAKRSLAACAVSFLFLLLPQAMWAHAILMRSTPVANSTVSAAGFPVVLRYNSRVDGARSKLTLTTKANADKSLPLGGLKQSAPDTLESSVGALAPGSYVLHWVVLASDGHISRGEVPFTVK